MKLSVAPQSNKVVIGDDDNVGTETGNKNDETDTLERKDVSEQEIEAGILARSATQDPRHYWVGVAFPASAAGVVLGTSSGAPLIVNVARPKALR